MSTANVNPNPMDKQLQESVLQYLETVKKELGEEEWKNAIRKQVTQAFRMGGTYEDFWREHVKAYDWINLDELKAKAAATPAGVTDINSILAQTFKNRMPGMKTQGQFSAFRGAFDAFEAVVNTIFNVDQDREVEARKLLDQAFLACKQATEISRKLEAVPEAATSKEAEEFKRPPTEFQEYDVQQQLLGELAKAQSLDELKQWYEESKLRRASVKSQSLRDILYDAIRARRLALTPAAEVPKEAS